MALLELITAAAAPAAAASLSLSERQPDLVGPKGMKAYAEWLRGEALKTDAMLLAQPVCAKATVSQATAPTFEQIAPTAASPGGGIVLEHLIVAGCGHAWRVNLAVDPTSDGGWESRPLLPGASLAGYMTQQDTLRPLLQVVAASVPDCKTQVWDPVQVLSPPEIGGAWVEEWKLTACGHPLDVDITFMPQADGRIAFSAANHKP